MACRQEMHTDIQDEWLKNVPLEVRQQGPPIETNITKLRLVILEASCPIIPPSFTSLASERQ